MAVSGGSDDSRRWGENVSLPRVAVPVGYCIPSVGVISKDSPMDSSCDFGIGVPLGLLTLN